MCVTVRGCARKRAMYFIKVKIVKRRKSLIIEFAKLGVNMLIFKNLHM